MIRLNVKQWRSEDQTKLDEFQPEAIEKRKKRKKKKQKEREK